MTWNRMLLSFVCVASVYAGVANAASISCPISLKDGEHRHALGNAALYDGPVEQMASLAPLRHSNTDRWDTAGVDAYLVCKYKGTDKTITLHAGTSRSCEAGNKPFRAYCK